MPSNVQLNSGTGGSIAATAQISHDGDTAQLQLVGLMGISGSEDAYTVAKINGDATNGIDVDVTRVTPGTSALLLGKAEDDAAASGDVGVAAMTVRQDTPISTTSLDGDYQNLKTDSVGRLWVNASGAAVPITDNSGSLTVDNGGTFAVQVTSAPSTAVTNAGTFAVQVTSAPSTAVTNAALSVTGGGLEAPALRVTIANDSTGLVSVDDNGGSLTVDGSVSITGTATVTGAGGTFPVTDSAGSLTVDAPVGTPVYVRLSDGAAAITTLPVSLASAPSTPVTNVGTFAVQAAQSGTWTVQPGNTANTTAWLVTGTGGTFPVTDSGGSLTVDNAGTFATQATATGAAAHDAAISGNPVRVAGRGLTTDYTAVAAGDTTDLATTLTGKQVTVPYSLPGQQWTYAAGSGGLTTTGAATLQAAGAAGVRNYLTHLSVINGHATVSTEVVVRDGASGTVLWRGYAVAAGGGVSESFVPPLRGTAATLMEVACITTGSAVYVNAQGFTAAE